MFDKFKELGQDPGMLKNLPIIQQEMAQMAERLPQIVVEGDSGAGMVKVKANGKFEVTACTISDEAMKLEDKEMLEDLVKAAVNAALAKARDAVQQATNQAAANMGLPTGFKLPGMG